MSRPDFLRKALDEEREHAGLWYMVAHRLAERLSSSENTGISATQLIEDVKIEVEKLNAEKTGGMKVYQGR